ncbi:hypothetical protein B484DRAFT_314960, partial [Ochromonadaceae sp. CCMP2298]
CPGCARTLCSHCRASHEALTCAQYSALPEGDRSPEDASFLALARENGFARCGGCHTFVQLNGGCNHITCHCRYEFCYQC